MYLLCYYQLLCDYGMVLIMILFFLFNKYTYALRFFLKIRSGSQWPPSPEMYHRWLRLTTTHIYVYSLVVAVIMVGAKEEVR